MLPFCELFLGFSKPNPTVITGQSVSAGRPRNNKNATYFIKMVGEFVCNVCGKQFMTKNALYDHNWGVHTEVESPCSDCDKIFRNKTKLAYHIKTTHQEKESFYCDVKSGEIECIYYSATKSNLRTHKKRVHEKTLQNPLKLVCGSCDYRTNTKFNLDRHSEKCKTLDPSLINHSCNLCNKTFSTKKNLTRHTLLNLTM